MPGSDLDLRDILEVATIGTPSPQEIRDRILRLEGYMKAMEQVDLPVKHHFAEGQYGREIFIPAGMLVVGKIHKHSHLNIISQGDISVVTEFGIYRVKAPYTYVSKPGTKRAVFTHTDTIWTTVHATAETDLKKIEEAVIATSYEALDELAFNRNLQTLIGGE